MRHPTKQERKDAADEVDRLLRLPDFDWEAQGDKHVLAASKWRIWMGLGAFTRKRAPAKRRLFVQYRLRIIYEGLLEAHDQQPRLDVAGAAFLAAAHRQIARVQRDIVENIAPGDLGLVVNIYSAAFRRGRGDSGAEEEVAEEGVTSNHQSVRWKLRRAVAEWQAVVHKTRVSKKTAKKARKATKNHGGRDRDGTDFAEEETKGAAQMFTDRRPGTATEFSPGQRQEESDPDYILRLREKIRQLRTKVVWQKAIITDQEDRIGTQRIRMEELRQGVSEEGEEEEEEEGRDSDDGPCSPWVSLAEKRRKAML